MERTEHKGIMTQLLGMVAPDNQATASELLTRLTDDYEQTLTDLEQSAATVTTLTENNETLRKVNANLFLKVGNIGGDPKPTETPKDEPGEPSLSFDALFNEKGDLL